MARTVYIYLDVNRMNTLLHYLENTGQDLHIQAQEVVSLSRRLQWSWEGHGANELISQLIQWSKQFEALVDQLKTLVQFGEKEINEWISVDASFGEQFKGLQTPKMHLELDDARGRFLYTKSVVFDILSKLGEYREDVEKITAVAYMATHLRWSHLRPNSIIFTGPNWMRETINIKAATRVIKPSTLGKTLAIAGVLESLIEGGMTSYSTFHDDLAAGHVFSHAISAAVIDGFAKFSISAIANVGLPLLLGAAVTSLGLPVLAAGSVVLAGSVLGSILYSHFIAPKLWDTWKHMKIRSSLISTGEHIVDSTISAGEQLINYTANSIRKETQKVENALLGPVRAISSIFA